MTQDEIIEMAMEAEFVSRGKPSEEESELFVCIDKDIYKLAKLVAEKAIKEALAQEQEPMAWMDKDGDVLSASVVNGKGLRNIPLYTAPPQIEVGCAECGVNDNNHALYCVACAERYLKDKNTKGKK